MQHQDWKTVILRPKPATGKPVHRNRKGGQQKNLESDDPDMKPPPAVVAPASIAAARSSKGWKQKDLAQKLNVTASTVQAWESGRLRPQGRDLAKLRLALGISCK
jgi:ribosome-binding protein aMBF1 (putative translation factor)